jgi:hypothetical protein
MRKLRPRLAAIRRAFLTACGKLFFEVVLSLDVALGMERTRHQLAPAMPGQEIVNGAVAGRMPYRLFIGRLEVLDVEQLARPGGLRKLFQQCFLFSNGHVLALPPADRLWLQRLDATVVIRHVGAVHRAERNTHRFRDLGLCHSALAEQHHLDALALYRWEFPHT